jgi:hypothetical protein
MPRYLRSEKSIPLLFAALTLLGYGLLSGKTGFHWDDWGFAWAARFLGPGQFIPSFAGFRPFLGPIFFITTSLIPPVPLYWQLFALLIRFCIGLSAWWALKSFWPQHRRFALVVALFLLVFPGYSQHWAALTHINQELIPFIFYLLSFGVTAHAIRTQSPLLTMLALLLQFGGLFPTEYFFGLEPLRLLFIGSMLEESDVPRRARRALMLWLPYLLLWLVDGLWLLSLYRSEAYISYGLASSQSMNLLQWAAGLGEAVLKTGIIAWGQVLILAGSSLPGPTSLLTFGLIAVVFILLLVYLLHLDPSPGKDSLAAFGVLAGLLGIALGRLPSLAAGLPLTLQSVFDRFTISMALGASLFAAGLIELLPGGRPRIKWAVVSLLIALGVGQQFFNANLFRRDWARQQEIFWQMAWRIPALKPGTLFLTGVIPGLPLETDLSFTAPVNWMFAPRYSGGDLPYALLYTEARLGGGAVPEIKPHLGVTLPFRTVSFHGSTDSALVILVPERGCLRVLDSSLGDETTYEKESPFLTRAIPLSDPSLIITDAPPLHLPGPPFIREPGHSWCYFYAQAELARQRSDWQHILEMEDEAASSGYEPEDVFEWLPFIEAHARSGNIQHAIDLSRAALKELPRVRKGLCNLWARVAAEMPSHEQEVVGILEELGCPR